MTRTLVNTLHLLDYAEIQEGVQMAKQSIAVLHQHGAKIIIACEHRWWEYGTGIQMLLSRFQERMPQLDILDVGSGWSGFGPALNYRFNMNVTEYEPVKEYRDDRERTNQILRGFGRKGTYVHGYGLEDMPEQQYDAVFCISVLEHVNKFVEKQCWKNLADRVRPNGLLFITCDVVDDPTKPHVYDEMRAMPNYTLDDMRERIELLGECGMFPLGKPSYTWNGAQVHDFTFFRAGFMKG